MDTRVTPYDLKWQASPISHPLLQIIFSLNKTSTIDWLISFKPSPRACPKHSQGSYQTRMLTGNVSEHMSPISNPDSSRLDRAGKTLGSRLISHIFFLEKLLTCFLRASVLSESARCRCILYSRVRNTCKALLLFYEK